MSTDITAASISAFGKARSTVPGSPLSADELREDRRLLASEQLPRARA